MLMDALTLSLFLLVLFIVFAVVLGYNMLPRVMDEAEYRAMLLRAVRGIRLNDMLTLLGIPFSRYIDAVPLIEINKHVLVCRNCTALDACDDCLHRADPDANMDFCPNHQSLLKHRKFLNLIR